jgi:hypothetical protein
MLVLIFVAALCVPNVQMTKTAFLDCVKAYPEEYWVARHYGVPQRIDEKSGSRYDWVYVKVNGREDKFTFGPGGQLQSKPKPKPTPKPAPSTLF